MAGSTYGGEGALDPRFFEDARMLFDKLDDLGALGRASEAAVRAPLPTLEDVRKLLEVVVCDIGVSVYQRSFGSLG